MAALNTIGQRLLYFRTEVLNISLRDMAEAIGTDNSYISRVERNKTGLGTHKMGLLAEKYKLNLHWLLTGKGSIYFDPKEQDVLNKVRVLNNKITDLLQ